MILKIILEGRRKMGIEWIKYCKKCGKAYDLIECPNCNPDKYGGENERAKNICKHKRNQP